MDERTTFRQLLVSELSGVVNSRELNAELVRMEYTEAKADVLGEFIDYYKSDLLKHEPFAKEFAPLEIEALAEFIASISHPTRALTTWSTIRERAAALLRQLQEGS